MGEYRLVILHNPIEGREEEFNRWLDDDHVPALLAVDGIESAQRFRLALTTRQPPDETVHRYMTIYEIETDDIAAFHDRLIAGKKDRTSSDAVDRSDNSSRYFIAITGDAADADPADGDQAADDEH
jgi:hypothetical protein